MSRGPLPWVAAAAMMGVAMVTKDKEFAVLFVVQYVACLRPSDMCNLTAGQVTRPLQGSVASSWALLLALQEELKDSKTAEFDESALLDGHLSVALGKALTRYTAGKTDGSDTPLDPISGKVRRGFCQMGRDLGSERGHDSSFLVSSRRSVVRCALAIVDGNSKTRQMGSEKSVRRYEKHAWLLKETSKLSDATRKFGQLMMSRMWRLLSGALPPPPPVLTRLVRNRA